MKGTITLKEGVLIIKELISETLSGNKDSFKKIYDMNKSKVYSIARFILKDDKIAEDILQDVFIQVYLKLRQLKSPDKFDKWIRRITFNLCMQHISKNKKYNQSADIDEQLIAEDILKNPDNIILKNEFKEEIASVIYELNEYQRLTILLFYFNELSIKEIAEIMKCSEGTVKSRLFNSKMILKEKLKKLNEN